MLYFKAAIQSDENKYRSLPYGEVHAWTYEVKRVNCGKKSLQSDQHNDHALGCDIVLRF